MDHLDAMAIVAPMAMAILDGTQAVVLDAQA